jgi:hypothetical protein
MSLAQYGLFQLGLLGDLMASAHNISKTSSLVGTVQVQLFWFNPSQLLLTLLLMEEFWTQLGLTFLVLPWLH